MHAVLYEFIKVIYHWDILYTDPRIRARIRALNRARNQALIKFYYSLGPRYELVCVSFSTGNLNCFTIKWPWRSTWDQRSLNSRPQSIMGIERLIARVASLSVDCWGVNISLTKPIWKLSNDKSVRLRYFVKRNSMLLLYCCDHHYDLCFTIPSLPFLNCMGHAVILAW